MITIFKELLFLKPYIFVGIDVAKHHHDAFILNHSTGEIISEHLHFDNTQKGFHSLIEAVLELEPSSLLFCMEATGHYHQALAHFLSSFGYNVGLLNPLQTNRLREVDLRRVKTDKIDAKVITKALVLAYYQSFSSPSMHTSQLKTLSRFRFKLVEQRSRAKVSLVNCLDLLFHEYASFF